MEQALIRREMYDRLQRCRDEMARNGVLGWDYPKIENLAAPFVPVRPKPEAREAFTALVIGQATRGYDPTKEACLQTYETTTVRDVELAEGYVSKAPTLFWSWVWDVFTKTHALLDREATKERLVGCLGWSNLAKIGDVKGNPPLWTIAGQAPLAIEALRQEVGQMKPTVVIACVGTFGLKQGAPIFHGAFGPESRDWDGKGVGYGQLAAVPAVFTPHPRTLRLHGLWDSAAGEVARHIASLVKRDR